MPSKKKTVKKKAKAKNPTRKKKAPTARKTKASARSKKASAKANDDDSSERAVVAVRAERIRRRSRAIASRSIRTKAALDVPRPDELARALDIDEREAATAHAKLEAFAKWVREDKRRSKQFEETPVRVLLEREPSLAGQIRLLHPELIEALLGLVVPGCDHLPKQEEYAECVRNILARVAEWMQSSDANRAVFANDTDTAVDSAAPFAPAVAKLLAKQALRTASAIQGGAA